METGIIGAAHGSYVSNSSSSGAIGARAAGGLIQWSKVENSGTPPTRIVNNYTTGQIGPHSGGLLGVSDAETLISRSYSTGFITNGGAGGIAGAYILGGHVENSYTVWGASPVQMEARAELRHLAQISQVVA